MREEHASLGTSFLVFLAGATVGAVVVALTTPKTGSELRGDLKGLGNKIRDRFTPMNAREEDRMGA